MMSLLLFVADAAKAAGPDGDIRDIRGPLHVPAEPPWTSYAVIVLAAAALIGFAIFLWRSRVNRPLNPYALFKLRLAIASSELDVVPSDAFAERVSLAVREYIEARCAVRAACATTDEFMEDVAHGVRVHPELTRHRSKLARFLVSCDLAKFARGEITFGQRRELCADAANFVDAVERSTERVPS